MRRIAPLPARVYMTRKVMKARAAALRQRSRQIDDQDSAWAASLRGKAKGYEEAAQLVEKLDRGWRLRPRKGGRFTE